MGGAVDGGLHIPHSVSKMPGYTEPEERGQEYEYDAGAHLERILGSHVQEYMDMLKEEDPDRYKQAFSKFIEEGKEEDMTRFSRKIFLRQDEWFHSSDFSSSDIASLNICKLDPSWIPRGIIAIPCLAEVGAKGVYSFEVHTDISGIKVTELADAKTKTLAGCWEGDEAGGSHLHPLTWRKNPKYSLKLNAMEEVKLSITLQRSGEEWDPICAKDPLGSMFGFYVYTGTRPSTETTNILYDGKPWNQTAFVPVHDVSTPQDLLLPPLPHEECYMIMPTTFEPGKHGNYFLSVSSPVDFVFKQEKSATSV